MEYSQPDFDRVISELPKSTFDVLQMASDFLEVAAVTGYFSATAENRKEVSVVYSHPNNEPIKVRLDGSLAAFRAVLARLAVIFKECSEETIPQFYGFEGTMVSPFNDSQKFYLIMRNTTAIQYVAISIVKRE